ncbi:MAG: hypothetical protein ACFBSE_27360 [Prochloraceae cyanobacterium]
MHQIFVNPRILRSFNFRNLPDISIVQLFFLVAIESNDRQDRLSRNLLGDLLQPQPK